MSLSDYTKLDIWNRSISLVSDVYKITKKFPDDEKFGLVSQMRRCAVSIPSNIAEGRLRGTDKEFCRFLLIALGSGGELATQLVIAKDLGFISSQECEHVRKQLDDIMRMINSFIQKLKANG